MAPRRVTDRIVVLNAGIASRGQSVVDSEPAEFEPGASYRSERARFEADQGNYLTQPVVQELDFVGAPAMTDWPRGSQRIRPATRRTSGGW